MEEFVHMSLERYNELIMENYRLNMELNSIVKIEADWNGEPSLKINLSKLAAIINDKFKQSEFVNKYTIIDLSNRVETIWGAFKAIP